MYAMKRVVARWLVVCALGQMLDLSVVHGAPPSRVLYGLKPKLLAESRPEAVAAWVKRQGFDAVFGGYRDPALRRALKRNGIKVFASLSVFVGTTQWRRHPRSRPRLDDGQLAKKIGWYAGVCPCDASIWKAKLRQLERLLRHRRVDGVWLDFMRFPGRWDGGPGRARERLRCTGCMQRFLREQRSSFGVLAKSPGQKARLLESRHGAAWTRFRSALIAGYVEQARAVVERVAPKAQLGIFAVPGRLARDRYGQDVRLLANHAHVISPMLYHRMVGRNIGWIQREIAAAQHAVGSKVLPVIQACSVPDKLSKDEFEQAIRAALRPPSLGVIVFSHGHMKRERRLTSWRSTLGKP